MPIPDIGLGEHPPQPDDDQLIYRTYQRGFREGFNEVIRERLLQRLQLKGDQIPEWVRKKLSKATSEQLENWLIRALADKTLQEVFD